MSTTRNDRNQELKQPTTVKGRRTHHISSHKKGRGSFKRIHSDHSQSERDVIIPDTMMQMFNFKNSNGKSWFVNNLGWQMQKELKVSYNDTYIYENTDEATYGTYEDLWKSDHEREQLRNMGIASETIRKVWSSDDGAPTTGDNYTLATSNNLLGIILGKVFEGHGPICTQAMADIKYLICFPKSEDIMNVQSGEEKGENKIENINLKFVAINGMVISRPTSDGYQKGRDLYYFYIQSPNGQDWGKDEIP